LHARIALAERFPALELRELLHHATEPLRGRLRQRAGVGLACPQIVDRGARRGELAGRERLLGGMQQRVQLRAREARLLLRGANLLEPALLDDQQRGFEAPRERRRADRAVELLPALGELRVVDRRGRRQLLGLDDKRIGVGERAMLVRPLRDLLLGGVEQRERIGVAELLRVLAQRRDRRLGRREALVGRRRGECRDPLAQRALEARARALLVLLALEALLDRPPRRGVPRGALGVGVHVEPLPAPIQIDERADDRSRTHRELGELGDDRIGLRLAVRGVLERVETLAREPRDAVILVARGFGEPAQMVGRVHALGRCEPRVGMIGGERKLGERCVVADASDRGAATLCVRRAFRDLGANRVGAALRTEEIVRARAVGHRRERNDERFGYRRAHLRVVLPCDAVREQRRVAAAARGGGANFRCGIVDDKTGELGRIRRQFRDAENALRRLGVLVQGGAREDSGDHRQWAGARGTPANTGTRAERGRRGSGVSGCEAISGRRGRWRVRRVGVGVMLTKTAIPAP